MHRQACDRENIAQAKDRLLDCIIRLDCMKHGSATCTTSRRVRGEVDLRAEHLRSEASRVRGDSTGSESLRRPLTRIPLLHSESGLCPHAGRGGSKRRFGARNEAPAAFACHAGNSAIFLSRREQRQARDTGILLTLTGRGGRLPVTAKEGRAMTIELPKGEIRQLNDAELDLVNGGSFAGQVALISAETIAVMTPAVFCPFPFFMAPLMTAAAVGNVVL